MALQDGRAGREEDLQAAARDSHDAARRLLEQAVERAAWHASVEHGLAHGLLHAIVLHLNVGVIDIDLHM
eukprot:13216310-Alexandrium_andersonii.AAC.1